MVTKTRKKSPAMAIIIVLVILSVTGVLIWGFTSNWGQAKTSGGSKSGGKQSVVDKEKKVAADLTKIKDTIKDLKKDPTVGQTEKKTLEDAGTKVEEAKKLVKKAEKVPAVSARSAANIALDAACACDSTNPSVAQYNGAGAYCKDWAADDPSNSDYQKPWCYTSNSANSACSGWDRGVANTGKYENDLQDTKKWRRCTSAQVTEANNVYASALASAQGTEKQKVAAAALAAAAASND